MKPEEEEALHTSFQKAREEDDALTLKVTQRLVGYQTRIYELIKAVKGLKDREAIFLEVMHGVHEPCNMTHCKICVAMQEATKS